MTARQVAADAALSLAAASVASVAIGGMFSVWPVGNLTILYIPFVLWLAAKRGRGAALLGSLSAFLIYDWFFIAPYHTLAVGLPEEWLSLAILLIVALATGEAYSRLRRQTNQLGAQARL